MKGIQNRNRERMDNECENQSQPRGICLFRDPEYALLQQVCRNSLKSQRNQAKDTQRKESATQHGNLCLTWKAISYVFNTSRQVRAPRSSQHALPKEENKTPQSK